MKRPCCICEKLLESALEGVYDDPWKTLQPYGGGEINLIFGYGSTKFDLDMCGTLFKGIICDDCAEVIVGKMKRVNPENGEEL